MKKLKDWAIRQYNKAVANLKELGWVLGGICLLLSGIIFYLPAIILVLKYIATSNNDYLIAAGTYITWWLLPAGSPAMLTYGIILLIVTTIAIYIKKKIRKKVARNEPSKTYILQTKYSPRWRASMRGQRKGHVQIHDSRQSKDGE